MSFTCPYCGQQASCWSQVGRLPALPFISPVADSWLLIDTAPKDGKVILIALKAVGALKDPTERRVYEGLWNDVQQQFTSVNGFILLDCASHWMPLPTPPMWPLPSTVGERQE